MENKTPLIFERLSNVMQDINAIDKTQTNKVQGFKFRGIDDVLNGVQPAMAKHQVFVTQEIIHRERKEFTTPKGQTGFHCINHYRFKFWTIDGSFVETFVDGEGIDYGDKSANKCMSIALKYALINTLLIPTKDVDDPDKTAMATSVSLDKYAEQIPANLTAPNTPVKNIVDYSSAQKHSNSTSTPGMSMEKAFVGEKMFAAFKAEFGVDRATIESFLGSKVKDINDNDICRLRDCYARLKAGDSQSVVFKDPTTADLY